MLTSLLIALFVSVITTAGKGLLSSDQNEDEMLYQKTLNDDSAEKDFARQSEFWRNYQSPNALMRQYKNLGASDTAALNSILGGTLSAGPSASSNGAGISPIDFNSTLPQMMQAFQNSINSEFDNQKTLADTENVVLQNEWLPVMNEGTLNNIYGQLNLSRDRLGLDKDIFESVTLPVANSTINKNEAEINKIQNECNKLFQEKLNLIQELENLKATEKQINAQTGLIGAQIENVQASTENLIAGTEQTEENTEAVRLENRLKQIDVELSEYTGVNFTLDFKNIGLESAERAYQNLTENVSNTRKAVNAGFDSAKAALQNKTEAIKRSKFVRGFKDTDKISWVQI